MKKLATAFLLFASALAVQAEDSVLLRVQVQLADSTSGAVEDTPVQVVLEPTWSGAELETTLRLDARLPGQVQVRLSPDTQWHAFVASPGFWSPRRLVRLGKGDSDVTLEAFPTATLETSIEVPVGEETPETLSVRFQPAPGERAELSGEIECPVVDTRLRCEIPAGRLDLRLRAVGFVSHYLWSAHLPSSKSQSLGPLRLLPGASVVGWVDSTEAVFEPDKVTVHLEPDWAGAPPGDRRQVAALRQETRLHDRGFFEFPGLPAGSYRVTATHPGLAAAVMSSVKVFDRAETEIHALTLRTPGVLEVQVHPPTDPFHVPWAVHLQRSSPVPGRVDSVAQSGGSTSDRGSISDSRSTGLTLFEGLEPGLYRLSLKGSRGSSWHWQEVTVTSGFNHQEVVLPIMRLAGTVTLGGEPLPDAEVWFGGRFGARKIGVTTREEGDFYAFLPVRDSWRQVDVWANEGAIQTTFHDVAVPERRRDQRWPEIELKLPDTRIEGEVVDLDGQRVEDTVVLAQQNDVVLEARATDGQFEFRGMDAGSWSLEARNLPRATARAAAQAHSETVRSDIVAVEVREDVDSAPLRLVVRPVVTLGGQVIDARGHGVPGAQIVGILEQAAELRVGMQIPETFTDASGAFELELPAATQRVTVNVFPPGFAATRVTTTLPDHDTVMIPVQQIGGDVILQYPTAERVGAQRQRTSLFHDGQIVAHPWAWWRWAELHGLGQPSGAAFTVPMLEPGTYTACFDLPEGLKVTGRLPGGFEQSCVSGELSAYGQLVLEVPGGDAGTDSATVTDSDTESGPSNSPSR